MALERIEKRVLPSTNRYIDSTYYRGSRGDFTGFSDEKEFDLSRLSFSQYLVKERDFLRFDNVSWLFFETPYLWWIVYLLNNIENPFGKEDIVDKTIKTPQLAVFAELMTRRR